MLEVGEAGNLGELGKSPNDAVGAPSAIWDFMQNNRTDDLPLIVRRARLFECLMQFLNVVSA